MSGIAHPATQIAALVGQPAGESAGYIRGTQVTDNAILLKVLIRASKQTRRGARREGWAGRRNKRPVAVATRTARSLLTLVSLCLGGAALAQGTQGGPPYPPWPDHRFDENWSVMLDPGRRLGPLDALKAIPLGPGLGGGAYVSFGGELRERVESVRNAGFGLDAASGGRGTNTYLLQRALLHADLQVGPAFRSFVQLGSLTSFGARGGSLTAIQDDRADLVQAFADVSLDVGATGGRLTLRGGRQEMSFGSGRFVSQREGPNLRRAFDGGRVLLAASPVRLDAFVVRPVEPRRFGFDDRSDTAEALWGIYASAPVPGVNGLSADLYYLGYEREEASFTQASAAGSATERRHTIGTRLFGEAAGWEWDFEVAGQFGSFGGAGVRAWTLASDTAYTFDSLPWQPRLGIKANIASGDGNPRDRTLGTFNALYPRLPYFSEARLVAPSNIIDVFPNIQLKPTETLTLELGWDVLWRHRNADAFYAPAPLTPVSGTEGGRSSFVGQQGQVSVRYRIGRYTELRAWYVHFFVGEVLTRAGGRDVDFAAASVTFRF